MTYKDIHGKEIKAGDYVKDLSWGEPVEPVSQVFDDNGELAVSADDGTTIYLSEIETEKFTEVIDTNYLIEKLRQINGMLSGKQKEYHDIIIKHAKVVHCVPMSEVLTPEQIERIKIAVEPKPKECFKNAQNVVRYIPGTVYVEGQYGVCGCVGVEHGFNRIGDKYFDVTAELALGEDVTKEDYISIMEVTNGYDILSALVELACYTALIPYFAGKKYLV